VGNLAIGVLFEVEVKVKVKVKAYTACSHTAPARWLSAARIFANLHFILKSTIHFPN